VELARNTQENDAQSSGNFGTEGKYFTFKEKKSSENCDDKEISI